jgi:hypothetical protein
VYSLRVLLIALSGFAALEGLIFHSGIYAYFLNPASTTGNLETVLENELRRPRDNANQVVGIGDSRMALVPRVANGLRAETGYSFATVAVAGTTPRVWYYILRYVDPHADRYSAIVFGMNSYDDPGLLEDRANRDYDNRFVFARLGLADLRDYAGSFPEWQSRWLAARFIIFRASAYNLDFQDFLLNPAYRIRYIRDSHENSHHWMYDYAAPTKSMEGVSIDWKTRTMTVPPGRTPEQKHEYEVWLMDPIHPDQGRESAYLHYWLSRIYERYRGSRTRLVFLRLPRGPLVRPDQPPVNPRSSVRELSAMPEVTLLDEHFFDFLERPDLFQDQMHLNRNGLEQFSQTLAREMRRLLGPPR